MSYDILTIVIIYFNTFPLMANTDIMIGYAYIAIPVIIFCKHYLKMSSYLD